MKFKHIIDPKSWKLLGIKRGIFKWQIISRYKDEDVTIEHHKLLKFLGAKMHSRCEIDAWEFRLSYFTISISGQPMISRNLLSIPIPFIKYDIQLHFRKYYAGY